MEYLTKKGLKISRKDGGYMVDGELQSKAGVLTIINRYRRAYELHGITMMDFD